jgi:hypothetical protein
VEFCAVTRQQKLMHLPEIFSIFSHGDSHENPVRFLIFSHTPKGVRMRKNLSPLRRTMVNLLTP